MDGRIDLHLHSTCSDGTSSPEEVVRQATEAGLAVISLTDHDSTEGVFSAQTAGKEVGVEVVPGVELSAQVKEKDLHILGYFVDCTHPDLVDCLRLYRDERKRRAERMVKKLNKMGDSGAVRAGAGQGAGRGGGAAPLSRCDGGRGGRILCQRGVS